MSNVEVAGQVIGPVLGPTVKNGKGSFTVTPDGLAWTLKKGLKKLNGVVPWKMVTRWDAGLSLLAPNAYAYVVLVAYENEPTGSLQLLLSKRPNHKSLVAALSEAARNYLPPESISVDFGSE